MYLFYSDLHVRPERIDDCEIVLNSIFETAMQLKRKHKDLMIVNAGDTFNTRGLIKTSCFDFLASHYEKWAENGLKQTIIVGNHDQEDKAGIVHPMKVFRTFKDWNVVDGGQILGEMLFVAYTNIEKAKKAIDVGARQGCKYATVHWGIQGALMNEGHKDTEGVPADWLKDFKQVFSGHYHYRNSFQNIQYIGSPMQQNQAEKDQRKGFLIFDSKKNQSEFVEIKGTTLHYELEVWSEDGKQKTKLSGDAKSITSKDSVKIKVRGNKEFCSTIDKNKIQEKLGCGNVTVDRDVVGDHISRMKITTTDVLSTESIMEKYINFIDTNLDRNALLEIGRGLL